MAYTAWVAFLLCVAPLHGARLSRVTSELSEQGHKKPICAPDIVAETCAIMLDKPKQDAGNDEGFITMPQVQVALSTSDGSVAGLWKQLRLPEKTTCTDLCYAIKEYLQEITVMPTKSDEGCYVAGGGNEVRCGLDFSPSAVGRFVDPSRPFVPSPDVTEEKPDPMKLLKQMWKRWSKAASKLVRNTTKDYEKYLSGATLEYPFQTMAKQLARRFRFFPAAGRNLRGHNASLVQTDPDGIGGTREERDLASERLAEAAAYLTLAMSHISGGRVDHLMTKYFGNSDAKAEMLRVFNSLSGMLENVAFAFPPPAAAGSDDCTSSTVAYVYPKSTDSNSVKEKCDGLVPSSVDEHCVANSAGELLYYLCPKFVLYDDISEQIQTMLHEGSHHFPSRTTDVCMEEFHFGNDQTEYKVVPWTEVVDEPLGEMVWTSKPDGQPLEKFTHLEKYPDYGVLATVWLKHEDLAVLKLSLSSSVGCKSRAYQPQKCLDLARLAPFAAVRNADSIGYFIVEAVVAGAYDEHTCTQVTGGFCVGEKVCKGKDHKGKHPGKGKDHGKGKDGRTAFGGLAPAFGGLAPAADSSCAGPLGLVQYPAGGGAASATMGDKVFLGSRGGTISYDMRPAHNFVKLIWGDSGQESELISVDRLGLEEEKVVVRLSGVRYPVEFRKDDLHRVVHRAVGG